MCEYASPLLAAGISGGGTALQNTTVDATFWSSFPKLTVLQLSGGAPYAPEMADTLDTLQRLLLSNASVGEHIKQCPCVVVGPVCSCCTGVISEKKCQQDNLRLYMCTCACCLLGLHLPCLFGGSLAW